MSPSSQAKIFLISVNVKKTLTIDLNNSPVNQEVAPFTVNWSKNVENVTFSVIVFYDEIFEKPPGRFKR